MKKAPPAPLQKDANKWICCERRFLKKSPLALSLKTFYLLKRYSKCRALAKAPLCKGRLGSAETPRLWREPRERKPLTCSFLIVWTNHIVGYLSVSASDPVLHRPIICTQYKVLCATFFQESGSFLFKPPSHQCECFILNLHFFEKKG